MEGEVVVAERSRPPHLERLLRAHDLGCRNADRGDALAVAQPLRGDRGRTLAVEEADEVGDARDGLPVPDGHQVLVLEAHVQSAALIGAEPLQQGVTDGEALARAALDVHDLALEERDAPAVDGVLGRRAHGLHGMNARLVGPLYGLPYPYAYGDRAANGGTLELGPGHGVVDEHRVSAHPDRHAARDPLELEVILGLDRDHRAALVRDDGGGARNAVDVEGLHLQFGKGATHAVAVHHRQSRPCSGDEGYLRVDSAALDRRGSVGLASQPPLLGAERAHRFHPLGHLLDHNGRGAHHRCGQHKCSVIELLGIHEQGRAFFLHGLLGHDLANEGVSAAPGAQDGGADREAIQVSGCDFSHGPGPLVASEAAGCLDLYPHGVAWEVRQGHLLHFDDLQAVLVRPSADRLPERCPASFLHHLVPGPVLKREDPVDGPRHLGYGRPDGVGNLVVVRLVYPGDARNLLGQEYAATSDGDNGHLFGASLHPVNGLLEHRDAALVGRLDGLLRHLHPVALSDVRHTPRHGDVRHGQRGTAEAECLFRYGVSYAVGPYLDPAIAVRAHDGAAAEAYREEVRHAEVGLHPAYLDGDRRLPRETRAQDADVGRGAPHVHDYGVAHTGQERRATDTVGGAASDGEDRVAKGVIERHERTVVLGEEEVGFDTEPFQRSPEGTHHPAGYRCDGGVEHCGVFALQEADAADLRGDRDGCPFAGFLDDYFGRPPLVVVADR